MKLARSHIIDTIILALTESKPITKDFKNYSITAVPYQQKGRVGNVGIRVTWENK